MRVLSNPCNKGMPKKNWSLMGTEWTVYGLRGTLRLERDSLGRIKKTSWLIRRLKKMRGKSFRLGLKVGEGHCSLCWSYQEQSKQASCWSTLPTPAWRGSELLLCPGRELGHLVLSWYTTHLKSLSAWGTKLLGRSLPGSSSQTGWTRGVMIHCR